MSAEWDKSKAAALKILGDGAEVPDLPDNIEKAIADAAKSTVAFDKSRDDIEAKLLAVQNCNDLARNAMKQFDAKIEKSDFKLNSKNKDDLKKIEKARKLLTGILINTIKSCNDDDKQLDELDKHIIQVGKYKQKLGPI